MHQNITKKAVRQVLLSFFYSKCDTKGLYIMKHNPTLTKTVKFVSSDNGVDFMKDVAKGKFDPCIAIVGYRFIEEGNDNA